jgi:hypothetical protein
MHHSNRLLYLVIKWKLLFLHIYIYNPLFINQATCLNDHLLYYYSVYLPQCVSVQQRNTYVQYAFAVFQIIDK